MLSGEEKGWEILAGREPDDVCRTAQASYDRDTGIYTLKSFGVDVSVSVSSRNIFCPGKEDRVLSQKIWEYSGISFIWYLASVKDIPLSGRLVRPDNLMGGHLFSKGTHVLPLDELAEKYHGDMEGFLLQGNSLDAEQLRHGDSSIRLLPVPGIPVILILWRGDDEFPPRVDLLFDSTCEYRVPVDVLWSLAMMTVKIMM
jgi:hypothetical protein